MSRAEHRQNCGVYRLWVSMAYGRISWRELVKEALKTAQLEYDEFADALAKGPPREPSRPSIVPYPVFTKQWFNY
jgi:hypothetical protein